MLTHDQNEVQPGQKDEIHEEGTDAMSKSGVDTPVTEAEPTVEAETVVEEPQDEPEAVPDTPAEVPAPEPQSEEPAPAAEPAPAPGEEPAPAAEEHPKRRAATRAKTKEAHLDSELMSMIEEHDSSFRRGEIKEGTVVNVNDKEVVVDIGFKSDGVIQLAEFEYTGIPELNSKILVFINDLDNGEGRLSLSKRKADFIKNIELIKQAHTDGTVLNGIIRRRVKGGMIVNVLGIEAFLPGSQMALKPIPNLDQFIGKELSFKVMNIDEEHRNIIVSRKLVLEEEANHKRQELLAKLQVDSELDGEVKNITQYGAFIDLGGIDGLLHVTDMSWGKINHPSDMLNIGDKVKVKVIRFDPETQKISLGLKQLVPHPWETIELKYPEGVRINGKVVSVKSFGAFIELEPGVDGMVHISEMSWTKKITDARKILKIGDTVSAIVLELDKENHRISLGMKQMEANPWLSIEDHYPIGTVLTRPVKSLTAFGAFVEIEDGIDGLIHISDISWTKRIYHPREVFRKGQSVEAVILSIDRALHRVALGIKQLSPDPWEHLNTTLPINTEVKGTIGKLIPKGVLVDVAVGENIVEGFIPISHLAIPKLEHSEDAFHVGEELPLKVIELDLENRRLILSVKAFFFSREPKLQEEYIALHEQYMRDRLARLQKKNTQRTREKRQSDKTAATHDEESVAAPAETENPAPPADEQAPATAQDEPAVAPEPEQPETPVEVPQPEVVEVPAETPAVEPEATPEPALEPESVATTEAEPAPKPQAAEPPAELAEIPESEATPEAEPAPEPEAAEPPADPDETPEPKAEN